jgi:signal peptidase I
VVAIMPQSPAAQPARNAIIESPLDRAPRKETNRDLVEQVAVALILAFLIRGFAAEAFVIPTGSMAPTLMGRHKDVTCPQCGTHFQVNASDEVEGPVGLTSKVIGGTCLNCRYPAAVAEEPSFKGDRILVMKFLYSLPFLPGGGGPDRWDVVVFKYPEEPEVNFIKRLVGLPNEELRLQLGDVLTRPLGDAGPFRFQRRPLSHQQAMQMLVYDDAHRARGLAGRPEWNRWRPVAGWTESADDPGTFAVPAGGDDWRELRYHHRVPDPTQWAAVEQGVAVPGAPRDTLVTDFYSYNAGVSAIGREDNFNWLQPHWVGDLTVSARVQAGEAKGTLRLELVEGGVAHRCEIDLATGTARLYSGDRALGEPAATAVKDTSRHDVVFANVDDRLTLWVDGRTPFGAGVAYGDGTTPPPAPTAADLAPVGIAAKGAAVSVTDLVLKRDIYYTQDPGRSDYAGLDLDRPGDRPATTAAERAARVFDALGDPGRFAELVKLPVRDFPIRPGHYMMLGDNSPRSKDGRGWSTTDQLREHPESGWDPNLRESWEVPESLLIGKAFFIYWPHAKPFWPNLRITDNLRVPFRPQVERMTLIR